MRVNQNIASLVSYNAAKANQTNLSKAIGRLTTGQRINSAADDAAGLAVSEKMRAQIRGLDQASSNAQDGISMIQTAEGALSETHSILQRMRELAVQAGNDTLTSEDRAYIQLEVGQLRDEIDRIAATTQFNKKKLLDGSASALWSSDKTSTEAIVRGGLTSTDQFGQRVSAEGNYRVEINAEPGEAEVQKSNLFAYMRGDIRYLPSSFVPGDHHIMPTTADGTQARNDDSDSVEVDVSAVFDGGVLNFFGNTYNSVYVNTNGNITFGDEYLHFTPQDMAILGLPMIAPYFTDVDTRPADGGQVYWNSDAENGVFTVTWEDVGYFGSHTDRLSTFQLQLYDRGAGDFDIVFRYDDINWTDGDASRNVHAVAGYTNGDGTLFQLPQSGDRAALLALPETDGNYMHDGEFVDGMWVFRVRNGSVQRDTDPMYVVPVERTLGEMPEFHNADGVSMVSSPQTVTIHQGDGRSADVVLYAGDTMNDAVKKINDAIAHSLGQAAYTNADDQFCTIADGTVGTSESVFSEQGPIYNRDGEFQGYENYYATMLVRSAVPGAAGELTFIGNEDVLRALGLNTIQESRESEFTAEVYDAHSGMQVSPARKVSGNLLHSAITEAVDVRFDPLANIGVTWNEEMKRFDFRSEEGTYSTTVHLADNTTILQTGANEREDFTLFFADMSASALGLDEVLVVSREAAARSLSVIDGALARVSRQRASLGAYQNRLEHTVVNLTTASTNMMSSESRIRDADMAKEMMAFTRLNIIQQSGVSMTAQANQLPEAMLSLLR